MVLCDFSALCHTVAEAHTRWRRASIMWSHCVAHLFTSQLLPVLSTRIYRLMAEATACQKLAIVMAASTIESQKHLSACISAQYLEYCITQACVRHWQCPDVASVRLALLSGSQYTWFYALRCNCKWNLCNTNTNGCHYSLVSHIIKNQILRCNYLCYTG